MAGTVWSSSIMAENTQPTIPSTEPSLEEQQQKEQRIFSREELEKALNKGNFALAYLIIDKTPDIISPYDMHVIRNSLLENFTILTKKLIDLEKHEEFGTKEYIAPWRRLFASQSIRSFLGFYGGNALFIAALDGSNNVITTAIAQATNIPLGNGTYQKNLIIAGSTLLGSAFALMVINELLGNAGIKKNCGMLPETKRMEKKKLESSLQDHMNLIDLMEKKLYHNDEKTQ